MRILTRYILSELIQTFLVALASMTVFVFLALIGKEAVENGLGIRHIVQALPYLLVQAMQYTVPGAMLMAATGVYGRVSASNEIVAIKSLGVSPMVVVWPSFALATAVSLGAVVVNDLAVSWGEDGIKHVIVGAIEDVAIKQLSKTKSYSLGEWDVTVQDVVDNRLYGLNIQNPSNSSGPPPLIRADEAEFDMDLANGIVNVRLVNANGTWDGWNFYHPGVLERPIPFDDIAAMSNGPKRPSNTPLREIRAAVEREQGEIALAEQEIAADLGFNLLLGRSDSLAHSAWAPREYAVLDSQRTLYRLRTEPQRRWANGFSCLGFVLIGAPMAIRRRHGEFWGSFFACFLPILLIFYPMLVVCVDQAKDGLLPSQSVWLGNIVLALFGAALMRRVIRF